MGLVLAICAFTLLMGYMLKAQCSTAEGWARGRQYERLCYNDIQPLYRLRAIHTDTFPYVEGRLADQELLDGAIEYPVLTGVFMWLTGLLVADVNSYLRVSAILLAPFGLLTAYLLARMAGPRALLWAAAPALVFYAFHNWDLLAVAAAVAGIWFWWRGRDVTAAVLFGIGGALKLYPVFLLAPLVLFVARRRGGAGAARVAAAGTGTLVAINLPFAIANFDGWIATYRFHSLRVGNFDSIWNLGFPTLDPATLNLVTGGLTAASFVSALIVGWLRSRGGRPYPFLQVAAAMVAAFLLFSKVHSPQYTLWILPFFALTSVSVAWWAAYALVDLAVYVGVFRWFYDIIYKGEEFTFFKKLMIAGVWSRAALLAALFVAFLMARRGVEPAIEAASTESAPSSAVPTAVEAGA